MSSQRHIYISISCFHPILVGVRAPNSVTFWHSVVLNFHNFLISMMAMIWGLNKSSLLRNLAGINTWSCTNSTILYFLIHLGTVINTPRKTINLDISRTRNLQIADQMLYHWVISRCERSLHWWVYILPIDPLIDKRSLFSVIVNGAFQCDWLVNPSNYSKCEPENEFAASYLQPEQIIKWDKTSVWSNYESGWNL